MRHPSEYFIKALMIREPQFNADQLAHELQDHGFLPPVDDGYFGLLRQEMGAPPEGFNPLDRTHRASAQYLRAEGIYEMFFPNEVINEATNILFDTHKRIVVEQLILSRLNFKDTAKKLNAKYGWFLSQDILNMYKHYYWNVNLLTYDHWGRYLYNRSGMYGNYISLLRADKQLAYFQLRLEQTIESKAILRAALEIAYGNLLEANTIPGPQADKYKAIGILNKAIVDNHNALSTSDMAMGGILKQLEKFRVMPMEAPPVALRLLAPTGNYTHSGIQEKKKDPA